MLTLQQFKTSDYLISLKKINDYECIISIMNEETGKEIRLEATAEIMRKITRILADSPFIFSERNNEK